MIDVNSPEIYPSKICTHCSIDKPLNQFWNKKSSKDWLNWWCKDCVKISYNKYYKDNIEKERDTKRIYMSINREKFKPYITEYLKEYYSTSHWKEKKRIIDSKRRAQKLWTLAENITQEFLDTILYKQDSKCNICWCSISDRKERHLDHIHPLCKWWTHTKDNLQWLCIKCNLKKWWKIYS